MRNWFAILLLFTLPALYGQTPVLDSLQKELLLTSNEKRIDILNQIAFAYSRLSLDKAEQIATLALQESTDLNYQKGIASANNNFGICNAIKGEYNSAFEYFIKALRIREETGDIAGASKSLNNLAGIFLYQDEYDKAIEYSKKGLVLTEKLNDKVSLGNAYISLGMIYKKKKDTVQALGYFNEARQLFRAAKLTGKEGQAWLKISGLWEEHKKYDRALEACFRAMDLIDVQADLSMAVELFQTTGMIYDDLGNEKSSVFYLTKAKDIADQYHDIDGRLNTRLQLAEVFQKMKRYDSALFYFREYHTLSSEVFNNEKVSQLAVLEKIYETEKKDQQLELSQQKVKQQYTIIILISIVLVIIVVLGFMLFRYSREKRKSNKELMLLNKDISEKNEEIRQINDNLEAEVDLRTQKIKDQNQKLIEYAFFNAHKVRGPLARVLGLVMLTENESSLEAMKDMHKKIHISALELDEAVKAINQKLDIEP